ncbi:hypothetical protein [Paratissierella segnis]|jgi:hypothetical protein|uniref:Uncharacterized protein n=1 Tax=Paratissierella segnis TaxID=2763679 RepID=A0A926ILA6_9FIRM|nr:hypothetical protein [Paratissierella segnis]MBC8589366.1 hypothetical protein [Paratissierella segnis]
MTNEQAIEYLSESTVEHKIDDSFAEMHNEAISLAIQALEKQKVARDYLEQLRNRNEHLALKIVVESVLEDILIEGDNNAI